MCGHNQKLLNHAKKFAADALKTSSKRVIQKTAEATGDLIGNKIADAVATVELRRFQKIHNKIIQRQLQMRMINKYLRKDIYLQKKYRKLLMN